MLMSLRRLLCARNPLLDHMTYLLLVGSCRIEPATSIDEQEYAAQGAFGTNFYDRSTRTIAGTMLWTQYRYVIKICPRGALGSHEIRPIHSAPSLGQSIVSYKSVFLNWLWF